MNKIKEFRKKYHKTQEQMANLIDCSTNTYIQKEKALIDFTVNEIKIIKAYFNLNIEETWKLFFEN